MKLVLCFLLLFLTAAIAAERYVVEVLRAPTNSNFIEACRKKVSSVVFQTLKSKAGVTYKRHPMSPRFYEHLTNLSTVLDAGVGLFACLNKASKSGYQTFMIHEDKCLAYNMTTPVACTGATTDVVYSISTNTTTAAMFYDYFLPRSEVRNFTVSLDVEDAKIKLHISFEEAGELSDLYNYKIEFDGKVEVVKDGCEVLTELSGCLDLEFLLTPYIDEAKWGESVTYKLPIQDIMPPVIDTNAVKNPFHPEFLTLSWTNFVQEDPCHLALGYTVDLLKSERGDADIRMEFALSETNLNLTCEEASDYNQLLLTVKLPPGMEEVQDYLLDPGQYEMVSRYFDKRCQVCFLSDAPASSPAEAVELCAEYGGRLAGREELAKGVEYKYFGSWLLLTWNTTAEVWQWDDGTILPGTDPLWAPGYGGAPEGKYPYYTVSKGIEMKPNIPSYVMCVVGKATL